MLPGLRFLFAATVLTMSTLIFGLGAAALLRAAHEEVASAPTRRAIPETVFAAPIEATRPTLALLRVEPFAVEQEPADNIAAAEPTAEAADVATPADRIAALNPENPALPDAVKPEIPLAQAPAEAEAAPAAADAPAPAEETSVALSEPVAAATNEVAPPVSEPASAPASADAEMAATKIATLGGPPVAIETPPPAKAAAKAADTTADSSAAKKRLQAQKAKERRRIAQRAQLARQAQQPADPFSQPAITTRAK